MESVHRYTDNAVQYASAKASYDASKTTTSTTTTTTTTTTTEYVNPCDGETECDINAKCVPIENSIMRLSNDFGKYQCVCNDGYRGSGKACRDINECSEGLHDCTDNQNCINIEPGFECIDTTTTTTTSTTTTTTTTTKFIDACLGENDCDVNAICNPIESGKYVCVCKDEQVKLY